MELILEYLGRAMNKKASDVFIVSGMPVSFKIDGEIVPENEERVIPERANELVSALYTLAGRSMEHFLQTGDSVSVKNLARFRVSAYRQRGSLAAVIRTVSFSVPDREQMEIPDEVMKIATMTRGLVLVTGPAGGGKSTTMACITDAINRTRSAHIITIEDPIEYLHRDVKSIVSQRELATDTDSYVTALRASLRQAPDVIMLGEM